MIEPADGGSDRRTAQTKFDSTPMLDRPAGILANSRTTSADLVRNPSLPISA
jgi:hypothetical protein